jgi:TldD protein
MTHTASEPIVTAVAVSGEDSQDRSFQGGARAAGWEYIEDCDLTGLAPRLAAEAVLKTEAEETPTGRFDLVLDPMHLSLTMHESVGHPTELDRILGWEANMAGTSFVSPEAIGRLKYGSELVSLTADNTLEGGMATWGYDDDGVPGRKWPIVKDGILAGVTTVRETAPFVGEERSFGSCRADSFSSVPITRIPNLYMEPGKGDETAEDIISGTDKGIYIKGMGSFSIDQRRVNFQFGGDFFQLIENGKLTRPLKKVTYHARTTEFWGSCDAVAGRSDWRMHGIMNCGKGEPMQTMMMTHGASTSRFAGIEVGASRK